jgi:catechol 2,3-dioxygenase-like lactoylglutathione lyase family enzyme
MHLVNGMNHVAVMTEDLDRFIDFYTEVFDLEVLFTETTPAFRHAILQTGPTSWLHPAEVSGSPPAAALPTMFDRGHLDHLALTASSDEAFATLRDRLVARGACSGVVEDLGAFHNLWFEDPDGMQVEVALIVDPALGEFHEPRPMVESASA